MTKSSGILVIEVISCAIYLIYGKNRHQSQSSSIV